MWIHHVLNRSRYYCAAVMLGVLPWLSTGVGGAEPYFDYQVKAAYLFNFLKFVQWPQPQAARHRAIRLCIWGDDPFHGVLDKVAGKRVRDRVVEVRYLQRWQEAEDCQLLYLPSQEQAPSATRLRALHRHAVLTVSDRAGFARAGGIIGLDARVQSLRMAINHRVARDAGLKISSKLLGLAHIVESEIELP